MRTRRPRRSRPFTALTAVAATALLVTACSSNGDGGSSASPSRTGSSSASTSTPIAGSSSTAPTAAATPDVGAVDRVLQRVNVQAADLPAGFTGKPAEPDSGADDGVKARLRSCTGVPGAPQSHKVATADSQDFTRGQVTVSSTFSRFQSQSDVNADVALINSPKINSCLNTVFRAALTKSLGSEDTVTNVAVRITPGSGGGPSNVVGTASGVVDITSGGQQATINIGVTFITGPELGGTLSYEGVNQRLDTATQVTVLTAVANRAQNP